MMFHGMREMEESKKSALICRSALIRISGLNHSLTLEGGTWMGKENFYFEHRKGNQGRSFPFTGIIFFPGLGNAFIQVKRGMAGLLPKQKIFAGICMEADVRYLILRYFPKRKKWLVDSGDKKAVDGFIDSAELPAELKKRMMK